VGKGRTLRKLAERGGQGNKTERRAERKMGVFLARKKIGRVVKKSGEKRLVALKVKPLTCKRVELEVH